MTASTGIGFVGSLMGLSALFLLIAGAGLMLADVDPYSQEREGRFRRWLSGAWRDVRETGYTDLPRCLVRWTLGRMDAAIRTCFVTVDRTPVIGGLFMAAVFVAIPLAATVNVLFGGSPFLFLFYLSMAVVLAVLALIGERPGWQRLKGVFSFYLGMSLVLIVPFYVLHSFTDRLLNTGFSHAVLGSLMVAPIYYLAAFGLLIIYRVIVSGHRESVVVHRFLAMVPVAFVLIFAALLAGHFAVQDQAPDRSWRLLLSGVLCTAAAVPITHSIMEWNPEKPGQVPMAFGLALAAAAGLSDILYVGATGDILGVINVLSGLSADGDGVHLGSAFWVMHLPFLPVMALLGVVGIGWLAKAVAVPLSTFATPETKPYLAIGIVCVALAALLGAAGTGLR